MSNPFNKLKVHRDEDEEEGFATVGKTVAHADPLFKKADDKAKKPKQRPKEEKKEETHQPEEETNEGFETVGKVAKKGRGEEAGNEEVEKKPHAFKQTKEHRDKRHEGQFAANSKKRVFDRHSGTGRGKEIPKDGAGKGNWGNQAKSAKREVVDYDDTEYYFQKALNPKKEEIAAPVVEEVQAPVAEEVKAEVAEVKEEKEYKKKDKKGVEAVVDEKDKLIIPENAISYKEWKQQVKRAEVNHKEVKVEVNLEQIVKDKDETIQVAGKVHTEKKKKVKEADKKELEVNKIFANAAVSKDNKEKPTYTKNQNQKNFKFNDNDFPSLK